MVDKKRFFVHAVNGRLSSLSAHAPMLMFLAKNNRLCLVKVIVEPSEVDVMMERKQLRSRTGYMYTF